MLEGAVACTTPTQGRAGRRVSEHQWWFAYEAPTLNAMVELIHCSRNHRCCIREDCQYHVQFFAKFFRHSRGSFRYQMALCPAPLSFATSMLPARWSQIPRKGIEGCHAGTGCQLRLTSMRRAPTKCASPRHELLPARQQPPCRHWLMTIGATQPASGFAIPNIGAL